MMKQYKSAQKRSFVLKDCAHAPPMNGSFRARHESVRVNMCVWRQEGFRIGRNVSGRPLLPDVRWANMKLKWKRFTEGWQQDDQRVFIEGERHVDVACSQRSMKEALIKSWITAPNSHSARNMYINMYIIYMGINVEVEKSTQSELIMEISSNFYI